MKRLTNTQQAMADVSFENLLKKVGEINPKLRETLEAKFEEDQKEFSEAAKEALPSDSPKYWAKRSCNKCYGRGLVGRKYFFNEPAKRGDNGYINSTGHTDLGCVCVNKAYSNWLAEFRLFYNMLKAQTVAETVNEGQDAVR